jgi:hypothetical protein
MKLAKQVVLIVIIWVNLLREVQTAYFKVRLEADPDAEQKEFILSNESDLEIKDVDPDESVTQKKQKTLSKRHHIPQIYGKILKITHLEEYGEYPYIYQVLQILFPQRPTLFVYVDNKEWLEIAEQQLKRHRKVYCQLKKQQDADIWGRKELIESTQKKLNPDGLDD